MKRYSAAFENFMSDTKVVEEAISQSTAAGNSGSGYSLELFDDGTFRVLWNNHIGNLYNSRGVIIAIPQLESDEIGDPDEGSVDVFDGAIEALRENFESVED